MPSGRMSPIVNWEPAKVAQFGAVPLQFDHSLNSHALFSESALARLIEKAGREDYYVNTMDITAQNLRSRREGEIRNLSGEEVLQAVAAGRIWILLLKPHKAEPAYADLLRDIYTEMEGAVPGLSTDFRKMTVLISSPNVQVYYHCDIPGQTLWQVRGQKRVYVYPNKEPFLNQAALEKIALGEAHEISLPYDPAYDDGATVYDLKPGQMLHWPLNAPHRIVNGNCVNVSFTTEHFSPSGRRTFYVNYANGVLRNRLGLKRLSQHIEGPSYWAKLGVAAAYKLTGSQRRRRKTLQVDFAVDPRAPHGVRNIPRYEYTG
jgi:hypothetical protein